MRRNRTLNSPKKVEEDWKCVLFAEVHQVLDLEGRVARKREGISLCIEQMPKTALDRVLFQGLLDLADLNRSRENA